MDNNNLILILDFGSQYTQLIARRIRENNVYSEIHPHYYSIPEIKKLNPKGIILSGGPMSVYDEGAPTVDDEIFELKIPVLGICYGMQLLIQKNGGKVEPAKNREYGKAELNVSTGSKILHGIKNNSVVWMSHGDIINEAGPYFDIVASTSGTPVAAVENLQNNIYGLQFHPEVNHTQQGNEIIRNFLFGICGCKGNWTSGNFIENKIDEIKEITANHKVICALSGGVDSSVAAVLVDKAVGKNLICVHIDSGLMRMNESDQVMKMFQENFRLNVIHINASKQFLKNLKGLEDPEEKRKVIGKTFIEIFEKEANKFEDVKYLVQGTLYPDVIESVSVKGHSVTIKTHHNVGGLPEKMNLKLIEPFRELFKDEVRKIGRALDIPEEFIERHPFPGPGLAVRILGEVTEERLNILRKADEIFINSIKEAEIYNEIWQAFAVLLPIRTVGVMGDARTYENVIALRAVTSTDGMTADWFDFDNNFLRNVSNKIIRSVVGINRVVYDISSKPPSTIEWE